MDIISITLTSAMLIMLVRMLLRLRKIERTLSRIQARLRCF